MADNQTNNYPDIKGAVSYSGDIKRDFDDVSCTRNLTSKQRLVIIRKYVSYSLSESQNTKILKIIEKVLPNHGNFYSLCYRLQDDQSLKDFGDACLSRFQFVDKFTKRWSLIYAIIFLPKDHSKITAELGLTRQPHEKLVARFKRQIHTEHRTKIGGFVFREARNKHGSLYMVPLECSYGDLDDIGIVKDRWRNAGLEAGVEFPEWPYRAEFFDPGPIRFWPSRSHVSAIGLQIGE